MPGPVGNRSDQLRGHGAKKAREAEGLVANIPADEIEWPEPMPFWHPLAIEWYQSLQKPAIACFLQQTDVAQARIVCQMLTDQLGRKGGVTPAAMPAIFSAMNDLLTTEGARRKLRIEIARRDAEEVAPVLDIVDRRNRLASGD